MKNMNPETINKYGRLTPVGPVYRVPKKNPKHSTRKQDCVCDCGSSAKAYLYSNLIRSHTQSCGCLQAQRAKESRTTHGLYGTIEYLGRTLTMSQWGVETGLGGDLIHSRLSLGWSVEESLTRPRRITKGRK